MAGPASAAALDPLAARKLVTRINAAKADLNMKFTNSHWFLSPFQQEATKTLTEFLEDQVNIYQLFSPGTTKFIVFSAAYFTVS